MSEKQIKVAVLMGGMSAEHEVSLNSGQGVVRALSVVPYAPLAVTITRAGAWKFGGQSLDIHDAVARLRTLEIDCVFIALHGAFGEDGRIQGMLDLLGLPYTGSGCAASALAIDKVRCKAVVQSQGVPVAGHVALDRATWAADPGAVIEAVRDGLGYPCVIKPTFEGSSVGIEIPREEAEFAAGLERAFAVSDDIMIEIFVEGTEVTCSVLDAEENGLIRALPVTEIVPKSSAFFDYEAKYTPGAADEITPARIPAEDAEAVKEMSAHVHEIVGCRGWSRSDFILGADGPVWIEVNTVPGLTKTSLYPQACAAAGISYARMAALFVEDALRRAETEMELV